VRGAQSSTARARGVERDALHLAGARGLVDGLEARAEDRVQLAHDVVHRRADPGAEIQHLAARAIQRQHVRLDHVADVQVVADRVAGAEDLRPLPVQHQPDEDRVDAGLAVRILARAVHVRIAEHGVVEAVEQLPQVEVVLERVLAHAVGRLRVHRMLLGRGQEARLAVQCSAGRGVDELLHAVARAAAQQR